MYRKKTFEASAEEVFEAETKIAQEARAVAEIAAKANAEKEASTSS